MIVDYSPRGGGKTTRGINWLKEDPNTRYFIAPDEDTAKALRHANPEVEHRIYSWREYMDKKNGGHMQGKHASVCIDNADMILTKLVGKPIDFISVNEYEDEQ